MHDFIYLNGNLLPRALAYISPFDQGFTVGCGVFESLKTYAGRAFGVEQHWQRLWRSAEVLGLSAPSLEAFQQALTSVITANQLTDARMRVTLTRGESPLGSGKATQAAPTLVVASMDLPQRAALAKVATVPWPRNERSPLAEVKSTSYAENSIALAAAQAMGAQEALLANTQGDLCEGTSSNVFLMLNGALCTPPLSSGCLAGVTRHFVLQLAQEMGLTVQQEPLPFQSIYLASEAFLTSTYREVQAIAQVDAQVLPQAPGPVTQALQAAFHKLCTAHD